MTTDIHEPCDRAQCPGCTAHTCTSRKVSPSAGVSTPRHVLIQEQALTRDERGIPILWYSLDGKVD